MLNISSAFKDKLEDNQRNYICQADITLADNTQITVTNTRIMYGGFSIEDAVSEDSKFQALGATIINSATLTLYNNDELYSSYVFDNAKVVLYVGLEVPSNNTTVVEKLKKGTYTVDSASYGASTITLTMLDYMEQFDRPYNSNVVYPTTLNAVVRDACEHCGIVLGTLTFPNDNYVIPNAPDKESTTYREVIGKCATIAGCFARCNVNGDLELKWFDTASLENNRVENLHIIQSLYSQTINVDDVVITGIRILIKNTDTTSDQDVLQYIVGTEGYVLEISDNEFITTATVSNVLAFLSNRLIGLTFRACSVTQPNDPSVEAGDVAYLYDTKGAKHNILITKCFFDPQAGQQIVCSAENVSANSATRFTSITKSYVETRKRLKEQKDNYDLALETLSNRVDAANGLYETQVPQQSGGVITYLHNKPALSESDIQIMISDTGITVTSNGTASKPTWYGLTVNGELISSILQTIGINFDWGVGGELIIRDTNGNQTLYVNANTGEVRIVANSLSVTGSGTVQDIANNAVTSYYNSTISPALQNLQEQIDGQIETWYYDYEPTLNNYPANEWTTEADKKAHEGDIFYHQSAGYSYRFMKDNAGNWGWQVVQDTDISAAIGKAQEAWNLANTKRRVFVDTPIPPYDVGDLWVQGSSGGILKCKTAKATGAVYSPEDWEDAANYADTASLVLQTPFEWSADLQTAVFRAKIYKGESDVTSTFEDFQFQWFLRTESSSDLIGVGKSVSVNKSDLGYGGTVVCRFTT